MKNKLSVPTFIFILGFIWYTFYSSMPQQISGSDTPTQEFSTIRALEHVKKIATAPHYIGSYAHEDTKNYIIDQLKKIGLSPEIQEGFAVSDRGSMSKPQNIIAKIKGTTKGKALLLLSHYDSSPHSSYGASDAGSGVATILEGVRAFLAQNKTPKNDIIICITDGEELGLNGAGLFVSEHPWAKDIGLVLNFEARGSGGTSYMLMETNSKNGKLIEEFSRANPTYPVTNSLAYSIYKLLPNDTDLTVFRKQGNISGYNFAFIDDFFDYHSANDTWDNLDLNTLQHQGSYLMPLLNYFSNSDITNLTSKEDFIYFNSPVFNIIKYPFSWIFPLLVMAILLYIGLIIYGGATYRITFAAVKRGFFSCSLSYIIASILGFCLWKIIFFIFPHYNDILHGFPYNGYYYIAATVFLSVATFFIIYRKMDAEKQLPAIMIAPLLFWIVICGAAAFFLPGASYFIIPVFFSLLSLFVLIRQKKPYSLLMVLLSLPSIYILTPFITNFPVALGIRAIFLSSLLTVLLCSFLLPVLGFYKHKKILGITAFILAFLCLLIAHFKAGFNDERQKPNSLVYIMNNDENKAYWASYDYTLDHWSRNYINPTANLRESWGQNALESAYSNLFQYINEAPVKQFTSVTVETTFDSIQGNIRHLDICIRPQRAINRMDLFLQKSFNFETLRANGVTPTDKMHTDGKIYNVFTKRHDNRLLTYHIRNKEPLELNMQFHKDSVPELVIYESSYDLLTHDLFSIPERSPAMIPKPFFINDAIMTKKTIRLVYQEKKTDSTTMTLVTPPETTTTANE
ncbi:M20/M25/M40 family metallo-hydrolase [Aquimarina addita]|uniref:Vacuolar membrane protease n=1 Tax=Aquimarina addita TaxID=870485 RepID=A0ABP7XC31_9FLAO